MNYATMACAIALLAVGVKAPSPAPRAILVDGSPSTYQPVVWLAPVPGGVAAAGEASTDSSGRLPLPPRDAAGVLLSASTSHPPFLFPVGEAPAPLRVAGQRRLRVVDALGGKPIVGAEVVAVTRAMTESLGGLWPGTSATTDRSGSAHIPLSSPQDLTLVRAPGFATSAAASGATTVALFPAAPLEGRLVGAAGRPLPGHVVRALAPVVGGGKERVAVAGVQTDARGGFVLSDVPERVGVLFQDDSAPPALAEREGPLGRLDLTLPPTARLTTRFVDGEGKAVADVALEVDQFDSASSLSVTRRVRSGADGTAVVAGLSSVLDRARLRVVAPGGTFDSKVLAQPLGTGKELGAWTLRAAAPARGTVVDSRGRPLAGVAIGYPRTGETLARTGRDGTFSFRLMEGQSVYADVSARGYVPAKAWIGTSRVERITLGRVTAVKVRARLPDGSAPHEAFLVEEEEGGWSAPQAGRRGSDGAFVFEDEPFQARCSLKVDGYEPADLGWIALDEGGTVDAGTVDLVEGPSLRGVLVDAASGEPLVGATVWAQPVRDDDLTDLLRGARVPRTTSGADGTFRVGGLPEGDVRLWVEAPGFAVNRFDADALDDGNDLGRLDVARGRPLELRLEEPDGEPAGGVKVVVRPGGFDGTFREAVFTSDSRGRVVIPRISPGKVALRATAGTRYVRRLVRLTGDEESLDWTLGGARVEGRVTVDGEPIPGVRVTLWYGGQGLGTVTDAPKTPDGIPLAPRVVGEPPLEPPTTTDRDGRFVFPLAGEGHASIRLEGTGWGAESRPVEVPASGRVFVDYALGAARVTARLVDASDVPVAPGQLGIFGAGGERLAASAVDDRGEAVFYLTTLAKARYLRGTDGSKRKGFRLLRQKDLTSEKPLDLVLGEGLASLTAEVVDGDRRAVPAARVLLVNLADGTTVAGRTDTGGLFVRSVLAEGEYRVLARGTAGGQGEAKAVVPQSGAVRVSVRLEPGGRLALRLEAPPDVDPTELSLRVLDSHGNDRVAREALFGRTGAFNDRGRYLLPALEPGRYRVEVSGKGGTSASESVEVHAARTTTRTLRMR